MEKFTSAQTITSKPAVQLQHKMYKMFNPLVLYSGKLARIWSCTAGFDVITCALVNFSIAVLT